MLWELINHGRLAHGWEYLVALACVLALVAGPTAAWVIWVTRPNKKRRRHGDQ